MRVRARMLLLAILPLLGAWTIRGQALTVAAAADLRQVLDELGRAFESAHPGAKVQASFGASGQLAAQIQQGAPYDLFLSADLGFPERLAREGLVQGAVFPYARGRLALWVRRDLGLDPSRGALSALLDPRVKRIALANPALAPYGRSAEAALKAASLLEALGPRLVFGENVGQAAQFLRVGAAEAGFISISQSREPSLARMGIVWILPENLHPPLIQGGVVLKGAKHPALAQAFRDFLIAGEGRALLRRLGLGSP